MGKTALLVVDMLNDFLDPKGSLYIGPAGREIIPFIQRKLEEARAAGNVIVFVCDAHAPDDREFELFGRHAVKGTWGAEIIPELEMRPGDYKVEKTRYSSFYQTDLEDILQREQVERAEVVGVCTSICVMETVRDLADRGIAPVVYRDGVADFDSEAHAFALKRMAQILGAKVI
jgi:nicotinamidase-related amidase|uniref:Cysteine hydrolase n=1 Tax=Desulfobacca acetoxidans TaxID=60893 RepID=A0A7C3WI50_9BACT